MTPPIPPSQSKVNTVPEKPTLVAPAPPGMMHYTSGRNNFEPLPQLENKLITELENEAKEIQKTKPKRIESPCNAVEGMKHYTSGRLDYDLVQPLKRLVKKDK
jgi:pyruvate/2-oxoacid:ferredoxin oxidoreductase alpha subunit